MTWFVDAFSVVGRAARKSLNVATAIVKPVLNAIISVTPGIASAARALSVIPIVGQAAVTVAQAAMVVQSVATTARDLIVTAENFQARTFPTKTAPVFVPTSAPAMSVVTQPKRLPTPEELFGVLPQRPVSTAPTFGGVVNNRAILPMPVRRRQAAADKKYERDLAEILELLDEPVEGVTTSFANMTMGVPKSMKTGHKPWGLGTEPRRYMGLEKRPWGV